MARSVKDLRELVCVSRLTMREDDDDGAETISRPMTSLSLYEERQTDVMTDVTDRPKEHSRKSRTFREKRGHRCSIPPEAKRLAENNNNSTAGGPGLINPKSCLPPVGSSPSGRISPGDASPVVDERGGSYDDVLKYINDETVGDWLKRANQYVSELADWCQEGENFVAFCHFWLTEFPLDKQIALLKLEVGVLLDEVAFALQSAIADSKVHEDDVKTLFTSLLPEYPRKLCSLWGQHTFLTILDTLSSDKNDLYKSLLTNVKLRTRQSSIAQKALSLRAYIVINLWKNVFQFYVNVRGQALATSGDAIPRVPQKGKVDEDRIFQAVRRGNVRVLHFILGTSSVSAKDSQGRTVAFASVLYDQPRVLMYLLAKHFDNLFLSEPCDSGNSCVHVAANLNHAECLQLLLHSGVVDVNQKNLHCDGATPLHLAIMQGHKEAVALLLAEGADRQALMNGVSPVKLADELGLEEMTDLLMQQL